MTLFHLQLVLNLISSQLHTWVSLGWILLRSEGIIILSGKVDYFYHCHIGLWVLCLLCWLLRVLTCLWVSYQNLFILCSWYHYTCNISRGTRNRQSWDHFTFPSCGLRPKNLSYLSSFLVSVPMILPLLYLHVEWICGRTFVQIWIEFHYWYIVYLRHGSIDVFHLRGLLYLLGVHAPHLFLMLPQCMLFRPLWGKFCFHFFSWKLFSLSLI